MSVAIITGAGGLIGSEAEVQSNIIQFMKKSPEIKVEVPA